MKIIFVIFSLLVMTAWGQGGGQVANNFTYPLRNADGSLIGVIKGRKMQMRKDGIMDVKDLTWETQDADGNPILVESSFCRINNKQKVISSEKDVVVKRGKMTISGRGYICELDSRRLIILNDVRVVMDDLTFLKGLK